MQSRTRDAFQVVDWIMSRQVHDYFDTAGRPIGEGRAAAFRHVQTDLRPCPYAGSRHRHPHPMNVTALQHMPPWHHLTTMLSWLSQRRRRRTGTAIMSCDDLARVTSAGVFLADFLVLRREGPVLSHEISTLISGLYKLCLGFQLAYLPERYAPGAAPVGLPDAAGFHAYLEANELLIGEAEVCAGSPAMIMQAYEAITGDHAVRAEDLPPPCASLVIDWDAFDVFADNAAGFWHAMMLFVLQGTGFVPLLSDSRLAPGLRDRFNACLGRHAADLLAGQTGLVVDTARAIQLYSGQPASAWRIDATMLPAAPAPSGLAETVMAWLGETAPASMADAARAGVLPVVTSDLAAQFAAYDSFEASVLPTLDRHVGALMRALGYEEAAAAMTPAHLSHLCGRTLRDWRAPPA